MKTCSCKAKTESRFGSCNPDLETSTTVYVTNDSHKVTIPYFRESASTKTAFLHDLEYVDHLDVVNLIFISVGRVVKFPVVNTSGGSVKLNKEEVIAKIDSAEKFAGDLKFNVVCGKEDLNIADLDNGLQESSKREKLIKILSNYYEQIKFNLVSQAKLPIEHEINVNDNIPRHVTTHSRSAAINQQIQ